MKKTFTTTFGLLFPFLLPALAYFLLPWMGPLSVAQTELIRLSPYAVFALGAVIGWRFNHSRACFVQIILLMGYFVLTHGPLAAAAQPAADIAGDRFLLVSLALPLNIALFALLKERGVFSSWGLLRMGLLTVQLLLWGWLGRPQQTDLLLLLRRDLVPFDFPVIMPLAPAALLAFSAAALILLIKQLRAFSPQDTAHLAVLTALLGALLGSADAVRVAVFFSVAGCVLILSILQASYAMAFTDELTGLPSRRALKQELLKLGFTYTIAMLDIDHFKKFNDTHGHDTGDDVLKLVAASLKEVTGGGRVFRYGGEEFTLLFPGKSLNETLPHLEELRGRIAGRGFAIRAKNRKKSSSAGREASPRAGKQVQITVSIGFAQKNDKHKKPDAVMKAADTALYRAKKKGRNNVSK